MEMRSRESIIALAATFLLHLLLLILFLLVRMDWNVELQAFTEIAFLSGTDQQLSPNQQFLPEKVNDSEDNLKAGTVQLPKRQMIETDKLTIPADKEKISADDKTSLPEPKKNYQFVSKPSIVENVPAPEKEIPVEREKFSLDEKAIPGTNPIHLPGNESQLPYTIEGEVAHRSVIYKILPQYPENLQKTATVRVQFTVTANGQIGEMIPLIKGDPELERITLNALKQWRFSPLPANQPQKTQIGVITFRYLLK